MKLIQRKITVVDPVSLYESIGARMRDARDKAGMTQEQVGIYLGMTRANVANLEAGKTAILLQHVYNLAVLLKIPISRLLPPL